MASAAWMQRVLQCTSCMSLHAVRSQPLKTLHASSQQMLVYLNIHTLRLQTLCKHSQQHSGVAAPARGLSQAANPVHDQADHVHMPLRVLRCVCRSLKTGLPRGLSRGFPCGTVRIRLLLP